MSDGNKNKHGLGRGFESLIPTDLLDESFDPTAGEDKKVSDLKNLNIEQIVPDENQPRQYFDDELLNELAGSIKIHGVLQPIVVTPLSGSRYKIVAGERRYRASKIAGLKSIPAIVRTLNAQNQLELSLIENIQRQNLNIIETATSYQKLHVQFNLSLEEIGKRVGGKSVSGISNTLRLLRLPITAKKALASGEISEGQAKPLVGLDDQIISEIVEKIKKEQWSARYVENYVLSLKSNGNKKSINAGRLHIDRKLSNQFAKKNNLSIKVKTDLEGEKGQIIINFANKEELEKLKNIL